MDTAQTIVMVGLTLIAVAGAAWQLVRSWEDERHMNILTETNRRLSMTNNHLVQQIEVVAAQRDAAYIWYAKRRLGINLEDTVPSTKES